MEIRHAIWRWGRFGGRLAIVWAEEDLFPRWPIRLERISGSCLEASHLRAVLSATLPAGWDRIRPPHPYRVEMRQGSSGCRDYKVRVLESARTLNAPVASRIHVSMRGLLNENIFAPVWAINAVLESPAWVFDGSGPDEVRVVRPRWTLEDFIWPEEQEPQPLLEAPGVLLEDPDEVLAS